MASTRVLLWNVTSDSLRVIELEAGLITEYANWVPATPRSRAIPPLLRVNREAREAAFKHCTVVSFDRATDLIGSDDRNFYFNAAVDVLHFGENTCLTTVLDIIRMHQDIPESRPILLFPRRGVLQLSQLVQRRSDVAASTTAPVTSPSTTPILGLPRVIV
jgi:hypothetical protein